MAKNTYTIVIEPSDSPEWLIGYCVEMPSAMTQGRTRREVIDNMKDAIRSLLFVQRAMAKAEAAPDAEVEVVTA